MRKISTTPFSTLTDEEYLRHLLAKQDPTDEDVESAVRLQMLLESYSGLLEDIYRSAEVALTGPESKADALKKIRELAAPVSA